MKGKVGTIFVLCTLAFAGIGIGYGVWKDEVVIHGVVDSTSFKVGLRAVGTNDTDNWRDPVYNESSGKVEKQDYNVGSTSISNSGTWKFSIGGKGYYSNLYIKMHYVYPNYAPTIKFRVGVSPDSPPAKILAFTADFTEKNSTGTVVAKGTVTVSGANLGYNFTIPNNTPPTDNTIVYNPSTGGPNMDIVSYTIKYDGAEYTGAGLIDFMCHLGQITIKPGTSAFISITLRFTDIPQSHSLDGNLTAIFEQAQLPLR